MATCDPSIDSFLAVDGELDVSTKFIQLMQDSLEDESTYMRAKDTMYHLFENLNINEVEKAKLVSANIIQLTTNVTTSAMTTALAWAKEERDGAYALAKIKADTEVALAEYEKVKSEICLIDKKTASECATVTEISARSIRDNGRPATFDADGCTVLTLQDEGLKYEQALQVEASKYQIFADAFRKSGVVQIGTDINDGVLKGLSGDDDGYTWQQIQNAERQRIAYEDSKLNHAANSSAAMIGQMLTAEIAPNEADVDRWRAALDGLLTKHSSTNTP